MKDFALLLALAATCINAFPSVLHVANDLKERDYARPGCTVSSQCDAFMEVSDAQANIPSTDTPATRNSKARSNCGQLFNCHEFNAEAQSISTSGAHAYQSPGVNDIRGPCPGLNAAANHGYLPRNGILNIQQTVEGLQELYGMSVDLSTFLAVYSIVFDGDVITGTWSIGGPLPANLLTSLTGVPQGISWSHNNYEGDTSITRCDAYINGGDAHSSSVTRFAYAYASAENDRYTLDTMSRLYAKNTHRSIHQNPYYFAPFFSTTLVSPAAYNFVINFFSNHTAEEPTGYLDGSIFKTFFGMTGTYPNFQWQPGQERIPDNWYKRPSGVAGLDEYSIAGVFGDLIPEYLAYPDTFRFGGNTNGPDTYAGIDIENITGGVYNLASLFEGDNLACFFFQTEQQAVPQILKGLLNDVATATSLILNVLGSFGASLTCPELGIYDNDAITRYTGYGFQATAPTTGPKNC